MLNSFQLPAAGLAKLLYKLCMCVLAVFKICYHKIPIRKVLSVYLITQMLHIHTISELSLALSSALRHNNKGLELVLYLGSYVISRLKSPCVAIFLSQAISIAITTAVIMLAMHDDFKKHSLTPLMIHSTRARFSQERQWIGVTHSISMLCEGRCMAPV